MNAIRRRAKAWEVTKLDIPRWRLMTTDRFTIRSDARIDDMRYAGAHLEEALALLQELLEDDPGEERLRVRIFRSRGEFDVYASTLGVPEAESFYNPRTREVVVYRDRQRPRPQLAGALLHEITHGYLHRAYGARHPPWLAEGLGEVMRRFDVSTGRLRVGHADRGAIGYLKAALESGEWIPLRKLVTKGREWFYGAMRRQAYAQSWLLVHHLMRRDGPETIRACLRGARLREQTDLPELEVELKEYIRKME
ncbi:MAG: DUF1570 domain-containing protein [Planctomycetota bacterium]|jgi:hypothetical protein